MLSCININFAVAEERCVNPRPPVLHVHVFTKEFYE